MNKLEYTQKQALEEIERLKPIEDMYRNRLDTAKYLMAQAEATHAISLSLLAQAYKTLELVKKRDQLTS